MICGACAATLVWAGSIYGDKSYEAYRYIYMTDYANTALTALSNLEYTYYTDGNPVNTSWMAQLGDYMEGSFNESSDRYVPMVFKWEEMCLQAPAPLLLVICSESNNVIKGGCNKTDYAPIYLSCGVDEDTHLLTILEDEDTGEIDVLKYPYYSSSIESKRCGRFRCEMDIKIYY